MSGSVNSDLAGEISADEAAKRAGIAAMRRAGAVTAAADAEAATSAADDNASDNASDNADDKASDEASDNADETAVVAPETGVAKPSGSTPSEVESESEVEAESDGTPPGLVFDHASGAVVAILAGVLLGVGAHIGALELLIAVAVAQAALIGSWVFGTALPGRIGALVIASCAAAGADTVVSVWPHSELGTLLPILGLALPAAFVHQLTRGVVRNRVVESLSDIAVLVIAVVAFAALIQLRHELLPTDTAYAVALIAAGALTVGHFTDMVASAPRFDPEVSRGLLAVLVSGIFGGLMGRLTLNGDLEFADGRSIFLGAAIGVVAALLAVGVAFIQHATSLPQSSRAVRLRPVFGTLLPLALVSPVAYLLCLAIHA